MMQENGTIVITVRDHLDAAAGKSLMAAATAAVQTQGASRLDIDLRELGSFTPEGTDALVSCRALGAQLADGLHYRTGRGAGRTALLSAYRANDTGEMQAITATEDYGTTAEH